MVAGIDEGCREKIKSLTLAGMSAPKIAATLGVSESTVYKVRRITGVSKPANIPIPKEDWSFADALHAEGCPVTEIARTIGVHPTTVSKRFPQSGRTGGRVLNKHEAVIAEKLGLIVI